MTTVSIDLNSDLGEGFGTWTLGDDEALLDVVTSANVACGFHAGDPDILRRVCGWPPSAASSSAPRSATATWPASAGAPSTSTRRADQRRDLPDRGAGRLRPRRRHPGQLRQAARRALQPGRAPRGAGRRGGRGGRVRRDAAGAGPAGVGLASPGRGGRLTTVTEAFADRGYTAQGTLVPRGQPGALLHDPGRWRKRMVRCVTGRMRSVDGSEIAVSARSICVHGDTPGAVGMAVAVREALSEAGIDIRAFAS